jgi:hypothetical protein
MPRKVYDDFFGEMVFIEFDKGSYFECRRLFEPIGKNIEIGLGGKLCESLAEQRKFYVEIEKQYASIIETTIPIIEDEIRNWKEDFAIKNFPVEFSPVYLNLTQFSTDSFKWEIAFDSSHDLNHQFTVSIKDFKAQSVLIDG